MIALTANQIRDTGTMNQGFLVSRDLTSDEQKFLARAEKVRRATDLIDCLDTPHYVAAAVRVHPQSAARHVAVWQFHPTPAGFERLELLHGDRAQAGVDVINARHAEIAEIEAERGFAHDVDFPAVSDKFLSAATAAACVGRSIRRNEVL